MSKMSVNVNFIYVIIFLFPLRERKGVLKMFTAFAKKLVSEGRIVERYAALNDKGMQVYAYLVEHDGKQYMVIRRKNGTAELIARKFS